MTAAAAEEQATSRAADSQQRLVFYRPELDCLRFGAFLAVFLHHSLPQDAAVWIRYGVPAALSRVIVSAIEAGGLGVDLFFVLSSYLITELLLREQAARGTLNVGAFYVRRILRIWPLYFAFLGLVSLFPQFRLPPQYFVAFALLAGNWITAFQGYPRSPAALLWSVSIEEQFYLTWPLLLRAVGVHRLKQTCLVLLIGTTLFRLFLAMRGVQHPGIWCNTLARLDPIVLGALSAALLRHRVPTMALAKRIALVTLGCTSLVAATYFLSFAGLKSVPFYSITALACTAILFGVLGLNVNDSSFAARALIYLGRISYGLYVFHVFTLQIFNSGGSFTRIPFAFVMNIVFASLSYHLLEQPFLRLKNRFAVITKPAARTRGEREADQAVSL